MQRLEKGGGERNTLVNSDLERKKTQEDLVIIKETRLYTGNILYRKQPERRWAWIALNAQHKFEIVYIPVDKQHVLQDILVVVPFNTGSDHH